MLFRSHDCRVHTCQCHRTDHGQLFQTQIFAALGGHGVVSACGFADIEGAFDPVVNATSASLNAELPPLAPSVFAPGALAFDMMYAKAPTVFLQFAAAHGARVRDGLGMLVEQAAEAFEVWRGVRPATAEVLQRLRDQL